MAYVHLCQIVFGEFVDGIVFNVELNEPFPPLLSLIEEPSDSQIMSAYPEFHLLVALSFSLGQIGHIVSNNAFAHVGTIKPIGN